MKFKDIYDSYRAGNAKPRISHLRRQDIHDFPLCRAITNSLWDQGHGMSINRRKAE